MEITVEIKKDDLLRLLEEYRDDFSSVEKKKIIEILCKSARTCSDNTRLVAEVAELIFNN
jgi:hypothetical protein